MMIHAPGEIRGIRKDPSDVSLHDNIFAIRLRFTARSSSSVLSFKEVKVLLDLFMLISLFRESGMTIAVGDQPDTISGWLATLVAGDTNLHKWLLLSSNDDLQQDEPDRLAWSGGRYISIRVRRAKKFQF